MLNRIVNYTRQHSEILLVILVAAVGLTVITWGVSRTLADANIFMDRCILEGNTPSACNYMLRHRTPIERLLGW